MRAVQVMCTGHGKVKWSGDHAMFGGRVRTERCARLAHLPVALKRPPAPAPAPAQAPPPRPCVHPHVRAMPRSRGPCSGPLPLPRPPPPRPRLVVLLDDLPEAFLVDVQELLQVVQRNVQVLGAGQGRGALAVVERQEGRPCL